LRLLTSQTDGWKEVGAGADDETAAALERQLTTILVAERLVILAGLGTSLCICDEHGERLAPTMPDLWAAAKEATGDAFDEIQAAVSWEGAEDIEALLSRCQVALELKPDEKIETFLANTEALIVSRCRFVRPGLDLSTHETFLRRVARRSTSLPRTQLFTTNYDLAFETAAARTGFAVIDGFSHAYPQRFDGAYFEHDFATRDRERAAVPVEWVPNVLQLHKLHGSVDWVGDANGEVRRDSTVERPLIIYPRSSKFELSYQQPFLELMSRFQTALRRPETGFLIIGSGFNDDHISQPVMAALRANVRLSLLIVSPRLDTTENPHFVKVRGLIERGDRRIGLLAANFEEFVLRVPDLVADTEAERHVARFTTPPNG
jgi:hypothetical protein